MTDDYKRGMGNYRRVKDDYGRVIGVSSKSLGTYQKTRDLSKTSYKYEILNSGFKTIKIMKFLTFVKESKVLLEKYFVF